jgi:CheY-specific phosphatase CheX
MLSSEQLGETVRESINTAMTTIFSAMPVIKDAEEGPDSDKGDNIAVSLGFGGKMEGNLTMLLSDESARKIVARMLGSDPGGESQVFYDSAGEIINIILGTLKTKVQHSGLSFALGIPSVARADESLRISASSKTDKIKLDVACADFNFKIALYYLINTDEAKTEYAGLERQKAREAEKAIKDLLSKNEL